MTPEEFNAKYCEAIRREAEGRQFSALDLPSDIAGFQSRPLSLRMYIALRMIQSPFIPPFATPTEDDIVKFLWFVSPGYNPEGIGRSGIVAQCRSIYPPKEPWIKTERTIKTWTWKVLFAREEAARITFAARTYMETALQDKPPENTKRTTVSAPSYYADWIGMMDDIAREFGWGRNEILDMPIAELFQHVKEISEDRAYRNGHNPVLFNPSDSIKTEFLKSLNKDLETVK